MDSQNPDIPPSRNEISLKDLMLLGQSYWKELVSNWKILILCLIPFVGYSFYKAFSAPDSYRARLTFMVNDESSKTTGYSSILANLGLGVSPSGEYNLDKILELSRSNLIVHRVLFTTDTIDGKPDYLANHLIRGLGYDQKWEGEWLSGLEYTQDSFPLFSRREKAGLKNLYAGVVGNANVEGCMRSSYSETSGIMAIVMTTPNEELSIGLADVMFDELSTYYIETAIEKSKDTYDRLKEKADSVRAVLETKQYQLASFMDSNRGITTQRANVQRDRLQGEIQMLTVLYGETVRNMEVSSFALKNNTPFITPIDRPFSPLWNLKPKWFHLLPKALVMGLFLGLFVVLGRRIFRDILASQAEEEKTSS